MNAMFDGAIAALSKAGWPPNVLDRIRPTSGNKMSVSSGEAPQNQIQQYEPFRISLQQDLRPVLAKTKSNIVFVADRHDVVAIRKKLSDPSFIQDLKAQGFTRYVIEAPASAEMDKFLEKYNQGKALLANAPDGLGPYIAYQKGDNSFLEVIESMRRAGIEIAAADHPANSPRWIG